MYVNIKKSVQLLGVLFVFNSISDLYANEEIMQKQNKVILKSDPIILQYDNVGDFINGFATVYKDKKVGLIDKTGKEIISPKYTSVFKLKDDNLMVVCTGKETVLFGTHFNVLPNKCGLIDNQENIIVDFKYNTIGAFKNGLAQVCIGNNCYLDKGKNLHKYGYIDKTGKEIIPAQYDCMSDFIDGLAVACIDDKAIFIDRTGKKVSQSTYDTANNFSENIASVRKDRKWQLIDKNWKTIAIIPKKYHHIHDFENGLALVSIYQKDIDKFKKGVINKKGKEIIPTEYDSIQRRNGFFIVNKDKKSGIVDNKGKQVTPIQYEDFIYTSDEIDLLGVCQNNQCGFIDKTGKEIVPLKYDSVGSFVEGFAPVKKNNKEGFIDKNGKEIIPLKYEDIGYFENGLTTAKKDENHWVIVDTKGNEVLDINTGNFYSRDLEYKEIWIEKNKKLGLINIKGEQIIPCEYDTNYGSLKFIDGLAKARLNGEWVFIDRMNNIIMKINNKK